MSLSLPVAAGNPLVEAGAGINPFNPFAADLAAALDGETQGGGDAEAVRKIKDMERQLQQAKQALASAGGGARGGGGAGVIRTPQGQAIYNDLLMRRRALFAVSRGLKPRGQVRGHRVAYHRYLVCGARWNAHYFHLLSVDNVCVRVRLGARYMSDDSLYTWHTEKQIT